MSKPYNILVEEVKKLTREEKEELKFLVEKYLLEERRQDIFKSYQESKKEVKEKKASKKKDEKESKQVNYGNIKKII